MKFVMLALALVSINASAASKDSCKTKIEQACYTSNALDSVIYYADSCKIAQTSGVENVVLHSQGNFRLTSVSTVNCQVSDYSLQSGKVTDTVVFDGRLFATISSGRVVIITRNNYIYELLNSKGKPYSDVVGVKGNANQDGIILLRERNQKTELSFAQIQQRLDDNKLDLLAAPGAF